MKVMALAVGLLLSGLLHAQLPSAQTQEARNAGITQSDDIAWLNFYAANAVRIFEGVKGGAATRPASELVHKQTGAAISESDLNGFAPFNPLMYELHADPQVPVVYHVGNYTVQVLSEARLQTLWKRHQINENARKAK